MKVFHILVTTFFLATSACSFKKEDVKQNETAKATEEVLTEFQKNQESQKLSEEDGGRLTNENVSVQFIEHEQPGSYQMKVTWPESVVAMTVQIGDELETTTLKTHVFERAVFSNTEYRVRLYSKNSNGLEIDRKELIVRAPTDVIINSDVTLNSNSELDSHRFYIYAGARIITNGHNLSIKTKKLYIGARETSQINNNPWANFNIITTAPNSIAQSPIQLEGSKITIVSEEAHGNLKVAFVGFNGQNGRNGDELDQARGLVRAINPALNGRNGEEGIIFKDTVLCTGRRGAEGACERTVLSCQKHPSNGFDGKQGLAGTAGENGQRGGNTGSFFIDVRHPKNFKVEVGQLAGKPGRGGVGGTGSPGGLGGQAGKNPGHPCKSAQNGKNGPQGPQGAFGATGANGTIGSVETGAIPATVFAL